VPIATPRAEPPDLIVATEGLDETQFASRETFFFV
jgi:hypothetical protein